MIELMNIRKTYYGKDIETNVLKGVNLTVDSGEFVCIYGSSGSGKSTLLNIIEKKHISQLSGGEQQRISIMRALSNKPEVLLADEPTGNLDSENSKKVMEILNHLNKKGMTIIMVTHDLSLAEYGSRIIHIEDSKIVER